MRLVSMTAVLAAGVLACGGSDGGGGDDGGVPSIDAPVAGDPDAAPPAPGPRWVGRVEVDGTTARFGWSGTGVVVRFRGTGLSIDLSGAGRFFTVVVDGAVQPRLEVTSANSTYALATGLPDAVHTVELYRRTEGSYGPTIADNLVTDGEILGVVPPSRTMEILGDSITCGYGNEGADAFCNFSADTENHYLTYGAIAARAVGAELTTIAWSGKGVIFNYGTDTNQPLPELYARTIPTEPASWTGAASADAVVINLGTNDFSTDGDPTETQFTDAYEALLVEVRARHPDALIIATLSPGLGSPDDENRAISYMQGAIARRATAGDARAIFRDLRVASTGFGCDYHPSLATHETMATALLGVLQAELGW